MEDKMKSAVTRVKMVKAMEFIARCVNDEEVFEEWLMDGVDDGCIADGDLSVNADDFEKYGTGYWLDDTHFADLMHTFLHVMARARKSGGLYCDGIVDKA